MHTLGFDRRNVDALCGIGGSIARKLARDGYIVVSAYRTNARAAQSFQEATESEGGRCRVVQADVTCLEDARNLVEVASNMGGPLSVVVNAAIGELVQCPISELNWSHFETHLETQVKAVLHVCQQVYPLMKDAGDGSIVNILSQVVHNIPPKEMAHYVTAKYALMGLSKSLAVEWSADHIRINMVSPGLARTELTQYYHDRVFKTEAIRTPLGRLVDAEDIAETVGFLAGNGSSFITGVNIFLTGGQDMP